MATKIQGKYSGEGNRLRFYDTANGHASAQVMAGMYFEDHFIGKAIDVTNTWTLIDTAGATETLKADQPGGVLELLLTVAGEAQLAGIAMADERPFTLNRGLNFETRVRFTVLPTIASVFCAGLIGDTGAAVDTIASSIWFRADANAVITVENDDTANETSKVATGVTFTLNQWYVLRISCDDYASCKFYIDGNQVAASTTFNMSTTPTLQMQPTIRMGKEAIDASLGVVEVDYVKVWQNLS